MAMAAVMSKPKSTASAVGIFCSRYAVAATETDWPRIQKAFIGVHFALK